MDPADRGDVVVELTDLHYRLLALLYLERALTPHGLAAETGVPLPSVEVVLSELETVGLLTSQFSH
jgi:DNA-binding transcriptional regulator GbsR (MarR family)